MWPGARPLPGIVIGAYGLAASRGRPELVQAGNQAGGRAGDLVRPCGVKRLKTISEGFRTGYYQRLREGTAG